MLKKTNAHFEKIKKQLETYEEAKKTYEKRKQQLIITEGWDSENLNALCENKPEFPISREACTAYYAWKQSESLSNQNHCTAFVSIKNE